MMRCRLWAKWRFSFGSLHYYCPSLAIIFLRLASQYLKIIRLKASPNKLLAPTIPNSFSFPEKISTSPPQSNGLFDAHNPKISFFASDTAFEPVSI